MKEGDFIRGSFQLSLHIVNIVCVDAVLEAATNTSNYEK
jgi:hypothetical protein